MPAHEEKNCPRCRRPFECKSGSILLCQCQTVVLDEEQLAWIAERDTWVEGRGQRVAAASVSVWPGPVPGGSEAERIPPGGTFVTGSRTSDA